MAHAPPPTPRRGYLRHVFGPPYRHQPVPELPHERNTLRIQLHRDISLTNLQTELEYESNHRPEQFFSEPRAATDVRNRMILIITGFPPDANYDAASILEVVRRFDGNADYA
ncbi:uncharacterized protein [Physcomitrium patens]|uniref:Uncharacterized protein n=1 Tax=Physcomitrium patens TaxID=3218 RepID=A0A7I4E1U6_PHYPA|nr:uncharacterized protein LOC112283996 [Physcomitrium patens]|eukprot:XP_024379202.1 uncharacterized protein LOC112283996 [Physcomitrella patens]